MNVEITSSDQIVFNVLQKYMQRSATGVAKYGTTLEENNKDNFFKHLQEELMDASLYVEKIMVIAEDLQKLIKDTPNDAGLGAAVRKMFTV